MSKRLYPSGSEKRKKAAHQKKLIEKLPKLESYLTKGETSISSHQLTNPPLDESCKPQIVKKTITLDVATNLLTSLDDFINNLRDKFDDFESYTKEKYPRSDYKDLSQRTKVKNSRQSFFDGPGSSVQLYGKDKFKLENSEFYSVETMLQRFCKYLLRRC
ncbi:hypothetical protein QTP88_020674 [Uroleucon formosanum]